MAEATRVRTRLYVPEALNVASIGLDADRAHYLRHVLRLERGDVIAVFNARDGEYAARIDGFGKGWCTLAVGEQRRTPVNEPDLWLVFAPIKRARLDFVAEKATELGVSRHLAGLHAAYRRDAGQRRSPARHLRRGGRAIASG